MEHLYEDTREPLGPSTKSSLNARSSVTQNHKKRKLSIVGGSTDDFQTFDATIISPYESQQTFTFIPISTILRAHLPLSWLSGSKASLIRPGAILRANMTGILKWDYHILVVKLLTNDGLFALERVDAGAYICHPLCSWVETQWVEQASFGAAPIVDLATLLRSQTDVGHSRKVSSASLPAMSEPIRTPTSPKIPKNRRGHFARLSILETRDKTDDVHSSANTSALIEQGTATIEELDNFVPDDIAAPSEDASGWALDNGKLHGEVQPDTSTGNTVPDVPKSGEDINVVDPLAPEYLRRQYLETLYMSKTSLAFYAKGPLSRARARARNSNASRNPTDLSDFYKESIVPSKKLDLKYRESLQKKLSSLVPHDKEAADTGQQAERKRKRTKLGKDGLWPLEGEYIERWWKGQEFRHGSSITAETQAAETKKFLSLLRMRETEMQILLILEVLALELRDIPMKTVDATAGPSDIKVESGQVVEVDSASKVSRKAQKFRDLRSELDLLVDRLCIWHSIGLENGTNAVNQSQDTTFSSNKMKDQLRDFCKDVVVPFYGSKLPSECQAICAKTGTPEISPRRPRVSDLKQATQQPPGTVLDQERPAKKRDLLRILNEDQNARHVSPPTLVRSATVPVAANVKREPSERPVSRRAMQKSVSFSNREVDLVADAKATAAKRRKLDLVAAQKRELDAAIETLKRPSRFTVAKSFMDEMEQRTGEIKSSMRKVEPIQISATPRRGRVKQVQADDYDLPPILTVAASSDDPFIPSSTAKPERPHQIFGVSRPSAKKRAVLSAISDTPSRKRTVSAHLSTAISHNLGPDEAMKGVSSSTLIASTPAISRFRPDHDESITATPVRMSMYSKAVATTTPVEDSELSIEQVFKDIPEIPEHAGRIMDRVMGFETSSEKLSLYDTLGWNDDYDL